VGFISVKNISNSVPKFSRILGRLSVLSYSISAISTGKDMSLIGSY
jgi:hypothetical protein